MKYEHDTVTINEPAPGHYVIGGFRPKPIFIPKVGHVCPQEELHISPEVPTSALVAIIQARSAAALPEPASTTGGTPTGEPPAHLAEILSALATGATRIGDLADALGIDKDAIKALDGQGFHVASGGWCKLNEEVKA